VAEDEDLDLEATELALPKTMPPGPGTAPGLGSVRSTRAKRLVVVGGGRGGVGKSTLALNLGVYFAQLGRSVVVCDADSTFANLHAMLGLTSAPLVPVGDDGERVARPVATIVPGLSLLPTPFDLMAMSPIKPSRSLAWQRLIASLDTDYVLLHIGSNMSLVGLDLFSTADVAIAVTAPEPIAIETTYGFMRALFARALRKRLMKERLKLKLVERAVEPLSPMATPIDIVEAIHRYDHALGHTAQRELARLAPRLVVGQTRLRSDLELGPAMSAIAARFLGIDLDYLGHVEHDDAAWLSIRKRIPLLIESPTSKSARNIERIARRVLAIVMADEAPREARAALPESPRDFSDEYRRPGPKNLYEVLGVARTAADDEIRRAYKRQREIFRDGSFPVVSIVTDGALRDEQARIEEAYDTLLDPNRRRSYDLSTFPAELPEQAPPKVVDPRRAQELLALAHEISREVHAETEWTGALLRKVREVQGVELVEIAQRTKISSMHLAAIEEERLGDLPALVYVQGFLQEYAKFLRLDPTQVSRTYLRRARDQSARE
jgi:flagellar biosynthesis protein FlhG